MTTGAGTGRDRPCRSASDSRRARATTVLTAIALKLRRAARASNVSRSGPRPVRNTASCGARRPSRRARQSAAVRRARALRAADRNLRRASSWLGRPRAAGARAPRCVSCASLLPQRRRRGSATVRAKDAAAGRRPPRPSLCTHAPATRRAPSTRRGARRARLAHRRSLRASAFTARCRSPTFTAAMVCDRLCQSITKRAPRSARRQPRDRTASAPPAGSARESRPASGCASASRTGAPPARSPRAAEP